MKYITKLYLSVMVVTLGSFIKSLTIQHVYALFDESGANVFLRMQRLPELMFCYWIP
jgi:hypothetical protein